MGLFDFASNIGKKLFNKDADAAAEITEYINADNPGIEGLSVIYSDGVATIIGVTDSTEAAQKAVLMAGNVNGVTEVVPKIQINDVEVDMATAFESESVEYYVIESGDSLSKIAKKYYQDAMAYPRIFEANREVIKDPDLIYPGQKIRIPLD